MSIAFATDEELKGEISYERRCSELKIKNKKDKGVAFATVEELKG